LTDDDLTYAEGEDDELMGKLQKKLGKSAEEIRRILEGLIVWKVLVRVQSRKPKRLRDKPRSIESILMTSRAIQKSAPLDPIGREHFYPSYGTF
jgi:hypothetical protein